MLLNTRKKENEYLFARIQNAESKPMRRKKKGNGNHNTHPTFL